MSFGYGEMAYGGGPYGTAVRVEPPSLTAETRDGDMYFVSPWKREQKILDKMNTIALMLQMDSAASTVETFIEYTTNESRGAERTSTTTRTSPQDNVSTVDNIPVSEDGSYRLVIGDYNENNAINEYNIGFIH